MYLVRFDNFVLFFIAVLANIWMLINNNFYYWDDYALVSHDYEVLYNWFYQSTGYLAYYVAGLHTLFLDYLGGVLAYRLFTFILNVFSGILFYKIMHHFFVISYRRRGGDGDCRIDALIVSSLFIMFPFYTAQYALIMLPYTVSILLFFAASYMVLFLKKRALVTFVSLILYLFSFTINSVLILYLFLMLALVLFTGKRFSIKFSYLKIKEYWLFFILPFIFCRFEVYVFRTFGHL